MLRKGGALASILRINYAALSITSSFPYPKLCEAPHNLGQMQMYVNYFNRCVKTELEKPTVGILLCKEKNDSVVQLTLPENSNIYASAYSLYLPDKNLLQQKLAEWTREFEEAREVSAIRGDAE